MEPPRIASEGTDALRPRRGVFAPHAGVLRAQDSGHLSGYKLPHCLNLSGSFTHTPINGATNRTFSSKNTDTFRCVVRSWRVRGEGQVTAKSFRLQYC